MSVSMLDLKSIVAKGGGIVIAANKLSTLDLKSLAAKSALSGAKIMVKNPHTLSALDLKSIAAKGKGNVTFDFFDV